jgi:hypothetical protein
MSVTNLDDLLKLAAQGADVTIIPKYKTLMAPYSQDVKIIGFYVDKNVPEKKGDSKKKRNVMRIFDFILRHVDNGLFFIGRSPLGKMMFVKSHPTG